MRDKELEGEEEEEREGSVESVLAVEKEGINNEGSGWMPFRDWPSAVQPPAV